eukprot:TRINITY_DN64217_c0_g1_i1.p1 TRINITY_DN64217_c0_g1~~TRINITY_DN64217_c0_g1_i1.p1  ORF type:complete len:621 (-),score=92.03 TRINITY_DN64217_c0_g1_i1:39-1901(-)
MLAAAIMWALAWLGAADVDTQDRQTRFLRGLSDSKNSLNCCDSIVGQDPPMLLACDASPDDHIVAVPFAVLAEASKPGMKLYQCGIDEVSGRCHSYVENSSILQSCIGQQQCIVDMASLSSESNNPENSTSCLAHATGLELRLRWTCHCDVAGCQKQTALLPPLPLHARGNILVDASGARFRLKGVNWAGAHIINVPGGLDRAPLSSLSRRIRALGFNVVRLTWSVESILSNPRVDDRSVAANPKLIGLHALDVMDEVITALANEGVLVWLDNHMSDTDWCCDRADCNGFWFNTRWSEDDWVNAWRTIIRRYQHMDNVVGAGLKNEPRSTCSGRSWGGKGKLCNASCLNSNVPPGGCAEMTWSNGPPEFQWRHAATRAGLAVLDEKPSLLVSISGLEYSTDLREAQARPVMIPKQNLVYEAHDYSWSKYSRLGGRQLLGKIPGNEEPLSENGAKDLCSELGSQCSGATCEGSNSNCTVRFGFQSVDGHPAVFTFMKELSEADPFTRYAEKLTKWWGYLLRDDVAPVFLSEFGFGNDFKNSESVYVSRLSSYILEGGPLSQKGGLDWAVWQLGGVQVGGTGRTAGATESYGLLNRCWTAPGSKDKYQVLERLMSPPKVEAD